MKICCIDPKMSRLVTKPTKWHVHPAKTQISLGIRPVWSESSLFAWRKLGSLATHWAHSEALWLDWVDSQADLSRLRWAHSHFVGFVWSESSLFAWRKLGSLATHWAHSLIWVFAGRKAHFVGFVTRRLKFNFRVMCPKDADGCASSVAQTCLSENLESSRCFKVRSTEPESSLVRGL